MWGNETESSSTVRQSGHWNKWSPRERFGTPALHRRHILEEGDGVDVIVARRGETSCSSPETVVERARERLDIFAIVSEKWCTRNEVEGEKRVRRE